MKKENEEIIEFHKTKIEHLKGEMKKELENELDVGDLEDNCEDDVVHQESHIKEVDRVKRKKHA